MRLQPLGHLSGENLWKENGPHEVLGLRDPGFNSIGVGAHPQPDRRDRIVLNSLSLKNTTLDRGADFLRILTPPCVLIDQSRIERRRLAQPDCGQWIRVRRVFPEKP